MHTAVAVMAAAHLSARISAICYLGEISRHLRLFLDHDGDVTVAEAEHDAASDGADEAREGGDQRDGEDRGDAEGAT